MPKRETILDKKKHSTRRKELHKILGECKICQPYGSADALAVSQLGPLTEYIAEMVEQAYLAGANALNLDTDGGKHPEHIKDTGVHHVYARNYAKDKGFRI